MINIFAHAEEAHETAVESLVHGLDWYMQLPLFLVAIAVVAGMFWLITKKTDKTLLLTSAILLVSGFALASVAPLVAVLSITAGLAITLLVTLVGIGSSPVNATRKEGGRPHERQ